MQVIQFIRIFGHFSPPNLSTRSNLHQTWALHLDLTQLARSLPTVPELVLEFQAALTHAGNLFARSVIILFDILSSEM